MTIGQNYLLHNDVAGKEKGYRHTDHKENIIPSLLGALAHELLVVDTEEKADGEKGKKATIEHLSDEDHHKAVHCKKRLSGELIVSIFSHYRRPEAYLPRECCFRSSGPACGLEAGRVRQAAAGIDSQINEKGPRASFLKIVCQL